MSNANRLSIAALGLAGASLAFALSGRGGDSEDTRKGVELSQLVAKIDRLEKRVEIMEERDARRGKLAEEVNLEGSASSVPGEDSSAYRIGKRLEELGAMEFFEKRREKMQEDYDLVLDSEGEMWTRLKSLSNLQEAGLVDDAVVEAVLPLWEESFEDEGKGGHTRWYLLEGLRGTTNPEFRTQVLDWIGTEESPKMRGQGVQALIPMLPDPNVEEWLRHLAETDPEEGVRNSAAKGLENLP